MIHYLLLSNTPHHNYAFPEEGPGTGADERILHDASTVMQQSHSATRQQHSALQWRRIMRSPITRAAAVIAVMFSVFWGYYQSTGHSNGTITVLSLLNAATATENAWYTGEDTVHIVKQIVIYPQQDANDPETQVLCINTLIQQSGQGNLQ